MTLGGFAVAVGAPRKWVQNTHAILGFLPDYTPDRARLLALVRALETGFEIPLRWAHTLAARTLERPDDPEAWRHVSPDGMATLVIDRNRFLTTFAANLSRARELYVERRRGRPRSRGPRGVEAAVEHGVDLTLLEDSLRRTPAERLRRLDEDVAFLTSMEVSGR